MSTPLPGQIRCPTCHRSTPPAAFCTQCGTAIPVSARARPRGLDRAELQERIRVHRPGDAAFRRGSPVGEGSGEGPSSYQPFRPEPEDELIIPAAEAGDEPSVHVDNTPPGFDDRPPPPPPVVEPPPVVKPGPIFTPPLAPFAPTTPVVTPPVVAEPESPPVVAPPPVLVPPPAVVVPPPAVLPPPPAAAFEPPPILAVEPPAQQWAASEEPPYPVDEYDDRYRPPDDDWGQRGSGISPLAIGGFVLLGVLAIAVGVFISGIFTGGVAQGTPSPTPLLSALPSASVAPTVGPSSGASSPASSNASNGSPVPFPDGFTARTEPCAEEPSSQDGCNSSGASVTGGSVWVWVGFRKGTRSDVLGITIVDAAGTTVGDNKFPLASIGCGDSCDGWARFKFGGLGVGNYTIHVNRNGQPAAEAPFTVTG